MLANFLSDLHIDQSLATHRQIIHLMIMNLQSELFRWQTIILVISVT